MSGDYQVLEQLTDQEPVFSKARYTVRSFSIRRNEKIAVHCTVRGQKAQEILERGLKVRRWLRVLAGAGLGGGAPRPAFSRRGGLTCPFVFAPCRLRSLNFTRRTSRTSATLASALTRCGGCWLALVLLSSPRFGGGGMAGSHRVSRVQHIDLGLKYDPTIGIYGMDFYVVMGRRGGASITQRRRKTSKVGAPHLLTKEESQRWFQQKVWPL